MNVEEVGQSLHDILFLGVGNDEEIRVQKELCLVYFRDVSHIYDLTTVYLQESFLGKLGKDMAEHFRGQGVTKVFTIESSGIAPAVFTARALGVPLVILKKQNAENLGTEVWQTEVVSYTKDTSYRLTLAKNYISDEDDARFMTVFTYESVYGFYWTATIDESKTEENFAYYRQIFYNSPQVERNSMTKLNLLSVRCVRDAVAE